AVGLLPYQLTAYLGSGAVPGRHGSAFPLIAPYQVFRASDGDVMIAAANDGLFARLCRALGLDELSAEPRFATNPDRLARRAELAADFLDSLEDRPVFPQVSPEELRSSLGVPLQDEPLEPEQVVAELAAATDPGLVAMPSGRYFGFVIGGGLPAALATDWLTS